MNNYLAYGVYLINQSMDVVEAIIQRRSIRQFIPQAVEEEVVHTLLKSAMYAPSARNTQSWYFDIINQDTLLKTLAQLHPHANMLNTAPLAMLICNDLEAEPIPAYGALNCAAATQNILLAAHGTGLGAVWLGIYPREERILAIRSLLSLPDHLLPISLVAIGYTQTQQLTPERFQPDKIHFNSWEAST